MPEFLRDAPLLSLAAYVLAFFGSLTAGNLVVGFLAERVATGRRIFAVPLAPGQLRLEAIGNVVFVVVTVAAFTAALGTGIVRFGEESFLRAATTFSALLLGFQIFYYGLHRAMHTRPLLWMHRWHHRSQVTTPLSAQSMHPAESVAWMIGYVGLPLAFSFVAPISFWGWAAYMAFNVGGNIVGHANVELAGGASGTRPVTLFANPWVYHALHHARWTGHYSFQAALMDRIGGTEFADWPALFARVRGGKPLESLKARGDEPAAG
jgi:sterol desaturase/sphingolipid hydroxylase (fatty acid hydroxylase superfamily)